MSERCKKRQRRSERAGWLLVRQECFGLVVINTLPSDQSEGVVAAQCKHTQTQTQSHTLSENTQTESSAAHTCHILNEDLWSMLLNYRSNFNQKYLCLINDKCSNHFLFTVAEMILFSYKGSLSLFIPIYQSGAG